MDTRSSGRLHHWYGDPVAQTDALRLQCAAERQAYLPMAGPRRYLALLTLMRARYWLDDFGQYDFELSLVRVAHRRRLRALFTLCYGQLLMAEKKTGAMDYLQQGLRLADGLIGAAEYFEVYNRHHQLSCLPLFEQGCGRQTLQRLLKEAAVIRKLTGDDELEQPFTVSETDTLINLQ